MMSLKIKCKNICTFKNNALYILDEDGFFLEVKGATEKICGYSSFELLGKSVAHLLPMLEIPKIRDYINRVLQGQTLIYHTKVVHKDSRKIEIQVKAMPIKKQGKVVGIYSLVKHL
ncbi:PAS domain S-box protein [Lysinibacillus yapensis]|uniref:PAS domain S-box protein n=1 Tax=Ureibacillus yapensis TaxID=2304605 RepID=A0A396SFA8_9BACL|nr:PAS domain S-box protein [Lysinibacillus yapensis]RHW39975.1 PAS domain S-box protein [Lysinibacillus yapensis]